MASVESMGFRVWTGRVHQMSGAHRHGDLEVNFAYHAKLTYLFRGRLVAVPPRRFTVFWAAIPHKLVSIEGRAEMAWITVPLNVLMDWQLPQHLTRALLEGQFISDVQPQLDDGDRLQRWSEEFAKGSEALKEIVELETQARFKRLALSVASRGRKPVFNLKASGLEEFAPIEAMAGFMDGHFAEPLRVEEIAAQAGLHPNYATTLFKRRCGMNLMEYLTLQRVAHAQHLLLAGNKSVLQISLDSGFGSLSRFYEAFKKVCGRSPKRFRAAFRHRGPRDRTVPL